MLYMLLLTRFRLSSVTLNTHSLSVSATFLRPSGGRSGAALFTQTLQRKRECEAGAA